MSNISLKLQAMVGCDTLLTMTSSVAPFTRGKEGGLMMVDPVDGLMIMHDRENIHFQYNYRCLTTNKSSIPLNPGTGVRYILTLVFFTHAFAKV